MIGHLKGEIIDRLDRAKEAQLVISVMDVGYTVWIPARAAYVGLDVGMKTSFFIYTHVREDQLDLYGFATREEKTLFLDLLSVTGMGPKGALNLIGQVEPAELVSLILSGDVAALTKAPGIGKKTAERLILELQEKMKKNPLALADHSGQKSSRGIGRSHFITVTGSANRAALEEAKQALNQLGYADQKAEQALSRIAAEFAELNDGQELQPEKLVRKALQSLSFGG